MAKQQRLKGVYQRNGYTRRLFFNARRNYDPFREHPRSDRGRWGRRRSATRNGDHRSAPIRPWSGLLPFSRSRRLCKRNLIQPRGGRPSHFGPAAIDGASRGHVRNRRDNNMKAMPRSFFGPFSADSCRLSHPMGGAAPAVRAGVQSAPELSLHGKAYAHRHLAPGGDPGGGAKR